MESADRLGVKYVNLTGDVLVSAGVMAYLGPFTATFRSKQLAGWVALCKDKSIPCSASPTLSGKRSWFSAVCCAEGAPPRAFTADDDAARFHPTQTLYQAGTFAQCSSARNDNVPRSTSSSTIRLEGR